MKNIVKLAFSVLVIITLFSCSQKEKEGDWDDNIKLSKKIIEFNASGDSTTITTGGSWWWVENVSVNGRYYSGFTAVTPEADNYKIQKDCFVVERRNKNTLFIKVDENAESINRTIIVCLEAGDYFDYVTITQKPR